jgi:hypothetical protein
MNDSDTDAGHVIRLLEWPASSGTDTLTFRRWMAMACACCAAWLGAAHRLAAQDAPAATSAADEVNAANNPLTPKITINLQDYFTPVLNRQPGLTSNEGLLRGVLPSDAFGLPQLVRRGSATSACTTCSSCR